MKKFKTGVVVTNRHKGGTPIIKVWHNEDYDSIIRFTGDRADGRIFIFKPEAGTVETNYGGIEPMTKRSAKKFDADYGVWFSS